MKLYRIFFITLSTVLLISGCSNEVDSPTEQSPVQLPTVLVTEESAPKEYTVVGSVLSDHRVDITSKMAGYIRDITVVEGQSVTRDFVLVILDDNDVESAIIQTSASVDAARAILEDLNSDLARYENLLKDESVSQALVRKTRLQRNTAQQNLNSASAAYQQAQNQREYTKITSPVEGLVVARYRRRGDLATPGVPILTIESQNTLLFKTFIPERYLNLINPGDSVNIHFEAIAKSLSAEILRIVPSADPVTRRFVVDIALPSESTLRSGMFGRVSFVIGSKTSLVIPSTAVFERGGLTGVFVVDKNARLRFRWLRLGRDDGSKIEVISGLTLGEKIVPIAQPGLAEGILIDASEEMEK